MKKKARVTIKVVAEVGSLGVEDLSEVGAAKSDIPIYICNKVTLTRP